MCVISSIDLERRLSGASSIEKYFSATTKKETILHDNNSSPSLLSAIADSTVKKDISFREIINKPMIDFACNICATENYANSFKIVKVRSGEKFSTLTFFKQNPDTISKNLNQIRFGNCDYYISKNSYCGNFSKTESLFSLDNIVIDIDNHASDNYKEIDNEVQKLIWTLDNDCNGMLPPFGIVYTGRGVQLWFGLESVAATVKWQYRYKQVSEILCDLIAGIISENQIDLEVDRAASVRPNGFVRLAGTKNKKRQGKNKITAERFPLTRLHLYDILEEYAGIEVDSEQNSHTDAQVQQTKKSLSMTRCHPKETDNYTPYVMKRIRFIERLVQENKDNCNGRRELILFHFYNAAVQCFDREIALKKVNELNEMFAAPLKATEVNCAIKAVDKKAYNYKVSKFLEELCISEEEKQLYEECTHSRRKEREQARQEKKKRNQTVQNMYLQGKTQKEISDTVGCSRATVSKIIPSSDVCDRDKKIAALYEQGKKPQEIASMLGCSKSTVYNAIKKLTESSKESRNEKILALKRQGKKPQEIADIVGCSRTTVRNVLSLHTEESVSTRQESSDSVQEIRLTENGNVKKSNNSILFTVLILQCAKVSSEESHASQADTSDEKTFDKHIVQLQNGMVSYKLCSSVMGSQRAVSYGMDYNSLCFT